MAVNYASKFSPLVDEQFTIGSLSEAFGNNAYDWVGVQTVKVYSRGLATLNDYNTSGVNRFGTVNELGNEVQEMTLSQAKSFTFSIDITSEQDTMGMMEAGANLANNVEQLIIPAIDTYRFAKLVAAAPASGTYTNADHTVTKAVTSTNAYEEFLAVQEILDNDKAPVGGRIAAVSPAYLNKIKLDENYVKRGDMATQIAINGLVGEIDNVPVVKIPSIYLPENVDFIITNPQVLVIPIKLAMVRILTEVQGIAGSVAEALFRYDAFALNKKADAIGVHKSAE